MRDPPSNASDHVCIAMKESIRNCTEQSEHDMRGRRMDGVKPT